MDMEIIKCLYKNKGTAECGIGFEIHLFKKNVGCGILLDSFVK